jgi:hypothetical protein
VVSWVLSVSNDRFLSYCLQLGGVIVAASGGNEAGISLEDAVEATSAEETVIVPVDAIPEPTEDNPDPAPISVNVMLAPSLNRQGGGIVWQQVGLAGFWLVFGFCGDQAICIMLYFRLRMNLLRYDPL